MSFLVESFVFYNAQRQRDWNTKGWPPSMPPLPMFLIAPLAVTEAVTMEATTIGTLSIFSDLVFWLLSSLAILMECSALTRAVRTKNGYLHFQFDFKDFFNHLLTRNKITTTNKINWLYWQLTELMLYLKYRWRVELHMIWKKSIKRC